MKRFIYVLIVILMFSCVSCTERDADATNPKNFEYSIKQDESGEKYIRIKKYIGDESDVVIPNYIDGIPVKKIGMLSFSKCQNITSLVVSENVELIDEYAFSSCLNLETVEIKSVSLKIGYQAFLGCKALKNLTLCEGVHTLDSQAFSSCTSLDVVHIPSTLNEWGANVFSGIAIKELTFADGIEKIGGVGCFQPGWGVSIKDSFKSVTIPASVKTIHAYSFAENLQEVIFLGDAPEVEGTDPLFYEKTVIKYKKGTKGWDSPDFADYTLVEID